MDKVDIYVATDIKGIRKASGSYIWLIEMQTPKGPVTLWDIKETEAVTGRIAELTALTEAFGRLTKPCEVVLHITNSNLEKTFRNNWIEAWNSSGWIDCKGEPVKDMDKWQLFYERFKKHTCLEISALRHSYSSWMQNQLGLSEGESSESRIKGSYDTIRKFSELIESLEISDFEENAELQTLINGVCDKLFEKIKNLQKGTNTGFVRVENPQTQINGSYGENIKIANTDESKAERVSNSANTDNRLVRSVGGV